MFSDLINVSRNISFLRTTKLSGSNKVPYFRKSNVFTSQMHPVITQNISAVWGHTPETTQEENEVTSAIAGIFNMIKYLTQSVISSPEVAEISTNQINTVWTALQNPKTAKVEII